MKIVSSTMFSNWICQREEKIFIREDLYTNHRCRDSLVAGVKRKRRGRGCYCCCLSRQLEGGGDTEPEAGEKSYPSSDSVCEIFMIHMGRWRIKKYDPSSVAQHFKDGWESH